MIQSHMSNGGGTKPNTPNFLRELSNTNWDDQNMPSGSCVRTKRGRVSAPVCSFRSLVITIVCRRTQV